MSDADESKSVARKKTYHCLCAHCGNTWTTSSKPSKCSNSKCGSAAITYSEEEDPPPKGKYQCFCTKCGNSWTSSTKPSKCSDSSCGSAAITYTDL